MTSPSSISKQRSAACRRVKRERKSSYYSHTHAYIDTHTPVHTHAHAPPPPHTHTCTQAPLEMSKSVQTVKERIAID